MHLYRRAYRHSLVLLLWGVLVYPSGSRAGEQAERALTQVKALIAAKKVDPASSLRIVVKEGNIASLWGKNLAIKNQWEQSTGIVLDVRTRPNQPVLEYMRTTHDFDVVQARQGEYPDLVRENLVADLTAFTKRFGISLDENPENGFLRLAAQSEFDHKIVAVPADGDVTVVYVRRDMMDDPKNKVEFEKKYHVPIELPQTWEDYQRLVEFFHRPEQGVFGTCEQRDPETGWMFWMPRYASQAYPNQYLFDDEMRPLINSPAGIRATESYVKTVPFSPPDIVKNGNHYSYALPFFGNGKAFSYIITMAGAKLFGTPKSAIHGKFISIPMPGTRLQGRLVRRNSFVYGNNLVVASASPQKELAFLFAMWFTDPDISMESIAAPNSITDPFRFNHLRSSGLWGLYTKQAMERLKEQFETAVPEGTGVPGNSEYINALSQNLAQAATGKLTPAQAMARTSAQWDAITNRLGRENQKRYWRQFKEKFPKE